MKKTNELFISLGWEVISAVLWTEGLLNSALDFLYLFSLLSLSLSSLSPFLCIWTARSLHYTGKLLIHGGTTGELFAVDWSRGVDSPVSDSCWEETCVASRCFFAWFVYYNKGFLCIDTPPPFFPQKCVCIYLFKQGFSVY